MGKFDILTREFLREIIEDANTGRTFVPFIGSGLSSPSGIVMGMEFTNYLAFTTYLVLCDPKTRKQTHGEGKTSRWNLSIQGWPPLPSRSEVKRAKEWIAFRFKDVCVDLKLEASFDEHAQIRSLVREQRKSLDDFALTMTQPPIPIILRSWEATEDEERLRQLRQILASGPEKNAGFLSPTWQRSDQSFHDVVVESGIRALSDWRETLEFLCRVRIEDHDQQCLNLGEPQTSVIDDFNTTITRDKRPSLGHKILAHLSEPLRICTLLTTNFDTLTEDAYRSLSLPLTVLPVSARGDLPNPRTASSGDALIKLHGESHDTRADLSLDEEPSEEDKAEFLAYMQRGTGNLLDRHPERNTANRTSRLLVVGYSGNDHRCVQMIKHWIEHSSDEPKVYWICYSESDQDKVERLFSSTSFDSRIRTVLTSRPDLLLYELYQRLQLSLPPGGLTYEFSYALPPQRAAAYDHDQEKVKAVQKKSCNLKEASELVAKYTRRMLRDATVMACCDSTVDMLDSNAQPSNETILVTSRLWTPAYRLDNETRKQRRRVQKMQAKLKAKPVVVNSSGGVVRASALAATKLAHELNKKVFWIELQDYADTDALLRDFLRSLSLRCGQFQSKHVTLHPLSSGFGIPRKSKKSRKKRSMVEKHLRKLKQHLESVLEEYRIDPSSVTVLLSGRDSYGSASGLIPNAWLDKDEFERLHQFIEVLGRVGVPTVYFPCTKARAKRKLRLIKSVVVKNCSRTEHAGVAPEILNVRQSWPHDHLSDAMLSGNNTLDAEHIADDLSVFNDILEDALSDFFVVQRSRDGALEFEVKKRMGESDFKKMEFLYALTLFRHSRNTNAIAAEGAFSCPQRFKSQAIDNDFVRAIQADQWANELCEARVFFTKPGGAMWMHRDIREAIHKILEDTDLTLLLQGKRHHTDFRSSRGRTHFWIGEWYHKAFCSSGHITPIVEAVYHLLSSAIYSQYAKPKESKTAMPTTDDIEAYRCSMFESAVCQASKTLLLSWGYVELWQASSSKINWLSDEHGQAIGKVLSKVVEKIDPSERFRSRLDDCKEQFVQIHQALHESVLLEGGRSERSATSWSTPDAIVMRLAEDEADHAKPAALPHGIETIRLDEEPFWKIVEDPLDDPSKQLWNAIYQSAAGKMKSGDFGKAKAQWKMNASTTNLQNFIWFLGEAAYVTLRRAKLKYHATGSIDTQSWLISTICCNLGVDLCKHLPAWNLEYEVNSKIKMHSIYSVGLANLGRFFEANRHLNEAQSLLSKWKHAPDENYAIISIRRAEVKLTECYWIGCFLDGKLDMRKDGFVTINRTKNRANRSETYAMPSCKEGAVDCWTLASVENVLDQSEGRKVLPPNIFEAFRCSRPVGFNRDKPKARMQWGKQAQQKLQRLYSAVLDEAVRSLEIAEMNLGGVSQSSLWWSRLHTLRMRVYGLLTYLPADAELCIIFRKQSAENGIFKNFLSAKRIAGEDDFRRLRALKYFLHANRWFCRFQAEEKFKNNGKPKKKHLNVYEEYLPESIEAARSLAEELWDRVVANNQNEDFLGQAITKCLDEYSEIDPRSKNLR